MEPIKQAAQDARRKYPRHKAPKGLFVAWKSAGQRTVSRAETIGMGGLYLHTEEPPSKGSIIELIFDLKAGEVRARAVVRHAETGNGMGVQFVQMQAADRARLNQFLSKYTDNQALRDDKVESRGTAAPPVAGKNQTAEKKYEGGGQFERELAGALESARNGTYYHLLGVSPDSTGKQIRQSFYALAQKFHPDHHMDNPERMSRLKELMEVATSAYKTLADETKRAEYDAHLAASGAHSLRRAKTISQQAIEQSFIRATECIRAGNFVGSIVWLRKCTELCPDEARYHALLARSLSAVTQYRNEAIGEFERAIALDPLKTAPYIHFAELYEEMQLPSRACLLYSKVLEIDPLNAKARERLALLDKSQSPVSRT
jgi:tetratricopeptide (TPR) repeat protein